VHGSGRFLYVLPDGLDMSGVGTVEHPNRCRRGRRCAVRRSWNEGDRGRLVLLPLPVIRRIRWPRSTARSSTLVSHASLTIIHPDNRASQSVIRKLGFAYWKQTSVHGDLRNLYRLRV
jgi:hypothetical protein